jgi:hypothetical protein
MKNDNRQWLEKQCKAFLASKLTDDILLDKAGLIREAASKRGMQGSEVSAMYQELNRRKMEDK